MKRELTQATESQRGFALVAALITMLVLSTLTTAFIYVSQTETWNGISYKSATQAHYLAEAGVEKTLDWMRQTYSAAPENSYFSTKYPVQDLSGNAVYLSGRASVPGNYPVTATQTSFYNALHNQTITSTGLAGVYEASAQMLQIGNGLEMWKVTSEGRVTEGRGGTAQVEAIIEQRGVPVFNYALYATGTGCGAITFSGGGQIDSWDSGTGTYTDTAAQTGGDVGTNGSMTLTGGDTVIYGSLSSVMPPPPPGVKDCKLYSLSDSTNGPAAGAGVQDGVIQLAEPIVFDAPEPIDPVPPTTNQSINTCNFSGCSVVSAGIWALAPGTYGNLTLTGGSSVVRLSAGTYNFNSITSSGYAIEIASGPVEINIQGTGKSTPVSVSGGGFVNTFVPALPSNLSIVYGGTGTIKTTGGTGAYGVIYAPNAAVEITGSGDWFGAIVGKKFTASGGSSIHYDGVLKRSFYLTTTWRIVSMSRKAFS